MISNDDGKKNTENKRKLCSLEFSHGDEVRIIIIFNLIRFISHKMQQQKNNYIYISLVSFFFHSNLHNKWEKILSLHLRPTKKTTCCE